MLNNILGPILGIVIGVAFVYFALSIVCSSVQEVIASLLHWRARDLEAAMKLMLGRTLNDVARSHPLLQSMGTDPAYIPARAFAQTMFDLFAPAAGGAVTLDRLRAGLLAPETGLLSGFHGATLVAALKSFLATIKDRDLQPQIRDLQRRLDALPQPTYEQVCAAVEAVANVKLQKTNVKLQQANVKFQQKIQPWLDSAQADANNAARALLPLVDSGISAATLVGSVDEVRAWLDKYAEQPAAREAFKATIKDAKTVADVRALANQLPPGQLRRTVLEWIDGESTALDASRAAVEAWFDQSMARVTDTYKRRIQWVLLIIAAVVVLVTGADTFRLVTAFQTNQALRETISAAASHAVSVPITTTAGANAGQAMVALPAATFSDITNSLTNLQDVLGYGDLVAPGSDGMAHWKLASPLCVFGGPASGGAAPAAAAAAAAQAPDCRSSWFVLLSKLLGLALTTAAVSLGAPFWFDVLSKAANLRGSGQPPPVTPGAAPNK